MAKVTLTENEMLVSLSTFESIQALRGSFAIPLAKIRGVTEDTDYIKSGLGIRSPGTGFPGLVAKGTFFKQGQKVLSLWHRGQELVVVELADSKWDRILIGCKDSKALAQQINGALAR